MNTASVGADVEATFEVAEEGGATFLTNMLNWFMLTLVCLRRMTWRWKRPHFWAAIESASAALALSQPIRFVACLLIRSLK